MTLDFIKTVGRAITGDAIEVYYQPYSISDVLLTAGVPPTPLHGIEAIRAIRTVPKTRLQMCLTGSGTFVNNRNLSGQIDITTMKGGKADAVLQLLDMAGIAFPIYCVDRGTDGSAFILGSSCREINTPEWRKSRTNGLTVHTFRVSKLVISGGIRNILS